MRRRVSMLVVLCALGAPLALPSACASDDTARGQGASTVDPDAPPAGRPLQTEAFAVDKVEAEGLDTSALTRAFADAIRHTAGAEVVHRLEVEEELGRCQDTPCDTSARDRYVNAPVVFSASLAKAGSAYLATGNAREGAEVLARASAADADPLAALRKVGWDLGARVNAELSARPTVEEGDEARVPDAVLEATVSEEAP